MGARFFGSVERAASEPPLRIVCGYRGKHPHPNLSPSRGKGEEERGVGSMDWGCVVGYTLRQ